jgi:outer membrane protein assembly factor BamB
MRRLSLAAFILIPLFGAIPAQAQSVAAALISPEAARRVGLERMWSTQLNLDRSRGRVAGLHLHVSATEAHTVFEVTAAGKRFVFSQHDRNTFGEEIGVEGAKKLAEEKLASLQADFDAGKKEGPPPALAAHVVPRTTLYATSERGMVQAIDAETGSTRWSTIVGDPRFPTTAAGANDKYAAVCNGSTLYVLLAIDGALAWSRPCVGSPGAGPALSDELVLVPMISGQIETFLVDDPRRPVAIYKSFGRAMVQPVVSNNSVGWPTDQGNLYVGLAHQPGVRFRLQANGAINSGPTFLLPDKIFVTSLDGYIYCVNEQRGNVLWRFTTGDPISHSPVALGNVVYAITDRGDMYAVDVVKASEVWVIPGIRSYLAGNEKRLYCLDTRGDLVVLDTASGSRLGTIAGGNLDEPLLNVLTDRIIVATSFGLVQCLRETNQPFPIVYFQPEAKLPVQGKKPAAPKAGETGDPMPTPMPPAADPFAAPPPAAGAAKPADDPFAAKP